MKNNRKNNCGRPNIDSTKKLVPVKGSIENYKKLALQRHEDKKQNEKELRDFLNFCANFAYELGSYEEATKMIKDYAIKTDTNKSCGSQCGGCNRDTKN